MRGMKIAGVCVTLILSICFLYGLALDLTPMQTFVRFSFALPLVMIGGICAGGVFATFKGK